MKLKINLFSCFLLLVYSFSYGQMEQYNYKCELKGISGQWHKIILPDELFGKVAPNLSDIRIFGITANNDTVEAPYLLRLTNEKISNNEVPFKMLNVAHNNQGYFFTFEIPTTAPINQIKLEFKQQNFDWRLKLEGSQDQQDWFTIADNYRILSIKNETTDFQFTTVTFPISRYRFFRLDIYAKEKPELVVASVAQHVITKGIYRNYPIRNSDIKENKQTKQTEIDVELQLPVPVNQIFIGITDTFDYYRPVTIKYLTDSIKTEQGWKYNYRTLTSGILNSVEDNKLTFNSTTVQRLKILISNQDNQPLDFDTIRVKGSVHELVARFTKPATYYLTYGNKKAAKPHYDIDRFADKLPKVLTTLTLGKEVAIKKEKAVVIEPLFKNKGWLWLIITLLIIILGWVSVKMIRRN